MRYSFGWLHSAVVRNKSTFFFKFSVVLENTSQETFEPKHKLLKQLSTTMLSLRLLVLVKKRVSQWSLGSVERSNYSWSVSLVLLVSFLWEYFHKGSRLISGTILSQNKYTKSFVIRVCKNENIELKMALWPFCPDRFRENWNR